MRLTVPQIIMLTHASETNRKIFDEKHGEEAAPQQPVEQHWRGKNISELTSEEYQQYMADV